MVKGKTENNIIWNGADRGKGGGGDVDGDGIVVMVVCKQWRLWRRHQIETWWLCHR